MNTTPALGSTEAVVKFWSGSSEPYSVQVRTFKFDSIRQEAYWVTTVVKAYRKKADAMRFAGRYDTIKYLDVV